MYEAEIVLTYKIYKKDEWHVQVWPLAIKKNDAWLHSILRVNAWPELGQRCSCDWWEALASQVWAWWRVVMVMVISIEEVWRRQGTWCMKHWLKQWQIWKMEITNHFPFIMILANLQLGIASHYSIYPFLMQIAKSFIWGFLIQTPLNLSWIQCSPILQKKETNKSYYLCGSHK
jgi:hypothetical protein